MQFAADTGDRGLKYKAESPQISRAKGRSVVIIGVNVDIASIYEEEKTSANVGKKSKLDSEN